MSTPPETEPLKDLDGGPHLLTKREYMALTLAAATLGAEGTRSWDAEKHARYGRQVADALIKELAKS